MERGAKDQGGISFYAARNMEQGYRLQYEAQLPSDHHLDNVSNANAGYRNLDIHNV